MQIILKKCPLLISRESAMRSLTSIPQQTTYPVTMHRKTTIVNAFLWCLFGKDIEDRKDYEIKLMTKTV